MFIRFNSDEALCSKNTSFGSDYQIIEADINLNYYNFTNGAAPDAYDSESVLTHEIGHVLGLTDKYDDWASSWTMYKYSSCNDISKRTLESNDVEVAFYLYD